MKQNVINLPFNLVNATYSTMTFNVIRDCRAIRIECQIKSSADYYTDININMLQSSLTLINHSVGSFMDTLFGIEDYNDTSTPLTIQLRFNINDAVNYHTFNYAGDGADLVLTKS